MASVFGRRPQLSQVGEVVPEIDEERDGEEQGQGESQHSSSVPPSLNGCPSDGGSSWRETDAGEAGAPELALNGCGRLGGRPRVQSVHVVYSTVSVQTTGTRTYGVVL